MPIELPEQLRFVVTYTGPPIVGGGSVPGILEVVDTEDGGLFFVDRGIDPDHTTSFARQYQVDGSPTVRAMYRPQDGQGSLRITLAGYRTARDHNMTGSGRVRFRDVVDGVEGPWSEYGDYTVTSRAIEPVSTLDPWGNGYLSVTLAEPAVAIHCEYPNNVYFVVAPAGCVIQSQSPGWTATSDPHPTAGQPNIAAFHNGSAKNPSALAAFATTRQSGGVDASRINLPVSLLPGDIYVGTRTEGVAVSGARTASQFGRSMIVVICLSERPPAGMMGTALYAGIVARARSRTLFHERLASASRFPGVPLPTQPEGTRNAAYADKLRRIGAMFRQGTTNTREAAPTAHMGEYHENTAADFGYAAYNAINSNLPVAEREKWMRGLVARGVLQIDHIAKTPHFYWWEHGPLVVGAILGIPEFMNPARSGISVQSHYDAQLGEEADGSSATGTSLGRHVTWDDLGVNSPALPPKWPAQNSPITSPMSKDGAVIPFSPSSPSEIPSRIPGLVYDEVAGTVTVPAGRAIGGVRAAREFVCWLDPRPATPNGFPFLRIPVVSGGNYLEVHTDTANSLSKLYTYTFQHMHQAVMNYLTHHALGRVHYSTITHLAPVTRDYMGLTREWLRAYSEDATRSTDPVPVYIWGGSMTGGANSPQQTATHVTGDQWWQAIDAIDAGAGVQPTLTVPGALPANRFRIRNLGNGGEAAISLTAYPDADGSTPINRWRYRINAGEWVEVADSRLEVEVVAPGFTLGEAATVEAQVGNAIGYGASGSKAITTTGPTALMVGSWVNQSTSQAQDQPSGARWFGVQEGDLLVLLATRFISTAIIDLPAGFTPIEWNYGGGNRRLYCAGRIATAADVGDVALNLTSNTGFRSWSIQTATLRASSGGVLSVGPKASGSAGVGSGPRPISFPALSGLLPDDALMAVASYGGGGDLRFRGENASALPSTEGCWSDSPVAGTHTGLIMRSNTLTSTFAAFDSDPLGNAPDNAFSIFAVRATAP